MTLELAVKATVGPHRTQRIRPAQGRLPAGDLEVSTPCPLWLWSKREEKELQLKAELLEQSTIEEGMLTRAGAGV